MRRTKVINNTSLRLSLSPAVALFAMKTSLLTYAAVLSLVLVCALLSAQQTAASLRVRTAFGRRFLSDKRKNEDKRKGNGKNTKSTGGTNDGTKRVFFLDE